MGVDTGVLCGDSRIAIIPMPLRHPSPRNQPWLQRHPRFERELMPVLRARIDGLAERRDQRWRE